MSSDTLIIVPTYNEQDNLESLAREVLEQLPDAHLLIVDDNSPDGTGQLADRLARQDDRIQVLHRPDKRGLGTAYIEGFVRGLQGPYEFFVEMDADFSHNPRYLPALLLRARDGADLVVGSRYVSGGGTENWGLGRRVVSQGGNIYARFILGVPIRDLTSGYKCFRRRVLEAIDLTSVRSEGYAFQIEMTYRALQQGHRVEEVPILFVDRRVGQSKMSRGIVVEAVRLVWRLRFSGPSRD